MARTDQIRNTATIDSSGAVFKEATGCNRTFTTPKAIEVLILFTAEVRSTDAANAIQTFTVEINGVTDIKDSRAYTVLAGGRTVGQVRRLERFAPGTHTIRGGINGAGLATLTIPVDRADLTLVFQYEAQPGPWDISAELTP